MTTALVGKCSCLALAALILIPGCGDGLDVKKQTVIVKFDEKSEKITIFSVYEGFHVRGAKRDKAALRKAEEELVEFVGAAASFRFLSVWANFSVTPKPEDSAEATANKRLMATVVEIGRGKLLLNEGGELSGFQTITIRDRKAFEKILNDLVSKEIANSKMDADTKSDPELSADSVRLLKKAAREGHRWVRIMPGQFLITIPMTGDDAEKFVAKLANDKSLAKIREAFGSFEVAKTDRGLAVTIGDGKSRIMTIRTLDEVKAAQLEAELLDFAKTPPMSIDRSQDTKAVMEKFRSSP